MMIILLPKYLNCTSHIKLRPQCYVENVDNRIGVLLKELDNSILSIRHTSTPFNTMNIIGRKKKSSETLK